MKGFVKDPQAVLDYSFDWGPWLSSDTISSSVWVAETGITAQSGDSFTDTTTTVFIADGTHGQNYLLKNTVVTVGGRTDERTVEIRIRNR